jgi:hypothetical protein
LIIMGSDHVPPHFVRLTSVIIIIIYIPCSPFNWSNLVYFKI